MNDQPPVLEQPTAMEGEPSDASHPLFLESFMETPLHCRSSTVEDLCSARTLSLAHSGTPRVCAMQY